MSEQHSTIQAVAYYRMSTDRQETSIAEQRREVEALAAKRGYRLAREYKDEGISGDATERRRDFQRMIRDAAKRDFSVILCWDQDRFGRFDPLEAGYWVKPLRDAGVRLETVAQGAIDWETFQGRLLYTIAQEGKKQFLMDLSRNSLRGQLELARCGDWLGGKPPHGYRVVERPGQPAGLRKKRKMLAPGDPADVEIVRWLFRTYAEQDVSIRWLGDELYGRGVLPPKHDPSKPDSRFWRPNTVRGILTRREYVGDSDWGREFSGGYFGLEKGEIAAKGRKVMNKAGTRPQRVRLTPDDFIIAENSHEPLIDRALWEAVQAKLRRNRTRTTPTRGGGDWLLSGLLVCGHCGSRMVGSTNALRDPGRSYVCGGYHANGRKHCHRHGVREAALLDCIARKIQADFLNPETLRRLRAELRRQAEEAAGPNPAETRRLQARIAALDADVARGEQNMARAADDDDFAAVSRAVREFRRERGRLQADLERLDGAAAPAADSLLDAAEGLMRRLQDALRAADAAEVRAVLREAVAKVELWWCCPPGKQRQRCTFARGVIHLKTDDAGVSQLEPWASASLWL